MYIQENGRLRFVKIPCGSNKCGIDTTTNFDFDISEFFETSDFVGLPPKKVLCIKPNEMEGIYLSPSFDYRKSDDWKIKHVYTTLITCNGGIPFSANRDVNRWIENKDVGKLFTLTLID